MMARIKSPFSILRDARKAIGLSQQELGDLLCLSRNTIRAWEQSNHSDTTRLLALGLKAYGALPHINVHLTGPCLAALRAKLGMTQPELGEKLGVSCPTISRWENGTPPAWVIFAITALAFME